MIKMTTDSNLDPMLKKLKERGLVQDDKTISVMDSVIEFFK